MYLLNLFESGTSTESSSPFIALRSVHLLFLNRCRVNWRKTYQRSWTMVSAWIFWSLDYINSLHSFWDGAWRELGVSCIVLLSLLRVAHSNCRAGWRLSTLVPRGLGLWLPEEPGGGSGPGEQSHAAVPGGAQEELHDLKSPMRFLFTRVCTPNYRQGQSPAAPCHYISFLYACGYLFWLLHKRTKKKMMHIALQMLRSKWLNGAVMFSVLFVKPYFKNCSGYVWSWAPVAFIIFLFVL